MPIKQQLICMQCGKEGPIAKRMADARQMARDEGWQTRLVVPGWDNDFCPDCAKLHPRLTCDGDRKPCNSRSLYTFTRNDGKVVHACGSHALVLMGQIVAGDLEIRVKRTPV